VTIGGSAISSEALSGLFERVPAVPGPTEAAVQLDVGLAIVKDLVALHGGRIGAETAGSGGGTIFTLDLPRPPRGLIPSGRVRRGSDAVSGLLTGVRVLLVDHDLGLREALQSVLDDYGAEVTAVGSAPEAMAALEHNRADVLLFGDLAVTDESVYGLMRQVMMHACPLPVASISSWRLAEKERELAAGVRLHLAKPLEIDSLIDAVATLAGRWPPPRRDLGRD
jgi:CheY-like chemotaxis protein